MSKTILVGAFNCRKILNYCFIFRCVWEWLHLSPSPRLWVLQTFHTGISVSDFEHLTLRKFPDSVKSLGSLIYHTRHCLFSKSILSHWIWIWISVWWTKHPSGSVGDLSWRNMVPDVPNNCDDSSFVHSSLLQFLRISKNMWLVYNYTNILSCLIFSGTYNIE